MKTLVVWLALLIGLAPVPALAQTRFYPAHDTAAPVSPTFGLPGGSSAWTTTSSAVRRAMATTSFGEAGNIGIALSATGTSQTTLFLQTSICNLDAQTINGTVKGQIRTNGGAHTGAWLAQGIYVTSSDGSTSRGVLLAIESPDLATTPPLLSSTSINRRMKDVSENNSLTLSSVSPQAGDCLVVEWGIRDADSNTSTAYIINDTAGSTDLAEDDTTTANNRPWIEFSDTITFGGGAGTRATVVGGGVF